MILRGAPLSLKAVRVALADSRMRADERTGVPAESAAAAEAPPTITVDLVRDWLAAQGEDVRRALAGDLAEQIEAEHAKARKRGWTQGHEEACARAEGELAARIETLERAAGELAAAFERDIAALAESCGAIVLEVLGKIAGEAFLSPGAVVGVATQVLRRARDAREVAIRVRPDDLAALRAAETALGQAVGASITLVADKRVELGGCIVESKLGNLDGRLEVQLAELCETLRNAQAERRKT